MIDKCLYNNKKNKLLRASLRKRMPNPEVILWLKLKNGQLSGLKFRRQYGIGNYILDFYCPNKRLAIEIDGESHFNNRAVTKDRDRDEFISMKDITILRFNNNEINNNIEGVVEKILEYCDYYTSPNPSYIRRGKI